MCFGEAYGHPASSLSHEIDVKEAIIVSMIIDSNKHVTIG